MSTENNEYSLQYTYEYLKDIQKEMQSEIGELTETIKNNPSLPLNENSTNDDIIRKQQRLLESLKKLVLEEDPKNYPIPKTKDMHATAIQSLENEHQNMNTLMIEMEKELSRLKTKVSYYEDKIAGYEKMKEAALNADEDEVKVTYEEEFALSKRIFSAVKADLSKTTETIFPDNNDLSSFMFELSRKQLKGGDDMYVEINEENIFYTNILEKMGIIVHHPNDKNICKMVNFL